MDRKNHQKHQAGLQNKSLLSLQKQNLQQHKKAISIHPSSISKPSLSANSSTTAQKNPTQNINKNSSAANKGLEISDAITSLSEYEIKQVFRSRSIKSKFDESEISDKYEFLDVYPCVECQKPIYLDSICRNFKDMNKDLEWALCANCQTKILPKLRIKYLKKKQENFNYEIPTPVFNLRHESCSSVTSEHYNCDESEVLYSPFHLKYNFYNSSFIESRLKLDIDYLKVKFNAIFWNSIWYFKIKDLPYDFISPYAEPLAERVKMSNFNNNMNNNEIGNNTYNVNNNVNHNNNDIINGIGTNRLDSNQNLISGINHFGNSSSSDSDNKNNLLSNGNSSKNVNNADIANMVNNNSSGADSKILKFVEDELECVIVEKEKEINFEIKERNFSIKDISNKLSQEDNNKGT